jgi:hypothetical protein
VVTRPVLLFIIIFKREMDTLLYCSRVCKLFDTFVEVENLRRTNYGPKMLFAK